MAQTKHINLLKNMLSDPLPAPADHSREVFIVRSLWLTMAGGWAWGSMHLWPGMVSSALLVGCAVAVVLSASWRPETPSRTYRVGDIR